MDNLLKKPILLASFGFNFVLIVALIWLVTNNTMSDWQNKFELEKKQKIQITKIWDEQATQNDDLISTQQTLLDKTRNYLQLVKNSVRFVDGQPLFYENVSQNEFDKKRREVEDSIAKIVELQQKNATLKSFNQDKVNQLYLQSGSVLDNRFNETGGIK